VKGRRTAIVGGGLLGLTLALRLRRAGCEVTIFEGAPQLGGLASAWNLDGVVWDRHYHVTLRSDLRTRGILRELGLESELVFRDTRAGFYADGRLAPVSNALDYLRLPALSLLDKVRVATTILWASRLTDWRRLEETPIEAWLVRLSGRRAVERLWRPLLRSKLGDTWSESSAAFLWATIQRLFGARRAGVGRDQLGYVPGGYARILERFGRLLEDEGVRIRLGATVERVGTRGGILEVAREGGAPESFESAVLTCTPRRAAALCPELGAEARSRLESVRYQGIVCASLLLDRPLAGYYMAYLTDPALPFTSVIEMSALVDRAQFGGRSLVYLPRYEPSDGAFFDHSDPEVEKLFLEGLERMDMGFRRADLACFRVSRVREVFPLPTLGYSRTLPAMTTEIPGLHIVNSAHIVNGTLNVDETVALAERAAAAMTASHGLHAGLPEGVAA
jgi:protoporphyrinogen oxidase